ncbi:MAG: class I SAM-dependent methyltransferase [Pyrinomonadaceae bacterium]
MVSVRCCLCDTDLDVPIGNGEDFEYRTSQDKFRAVRCPTCGLVFLNPRPSENEFGRIYPPNYHAFEFSEEEFGLVFKVRRRLEAKRLLGWCRGLPENGRILDIGCGDGFHLGLLKEFGPKTWRLEGVDADARATAVAKKNGLTVHCGVLEQLDLPKATYDLAFVIQTIEHVADPPKLLRDIRELLRPGGKVVIVTDNTGTLDFRWFKGRHWGGYHFPRHWNLFNQSTIRKLAGQVEFEVESLTTAVSPVNWVYSIRNYLSDKNAPAWMVERFSLRSTVSLSLFTAVDLLNRFAGHGALLNAVLKRPG